MLDAGALARFGRIEVEPGSQSYEILTRTGNVEQPVRGRGDWGWSDWQPLKDGAVASPAGRFLQWKAVLARRRQTGQRGRELSARECRTGRWTTGGRAGRAPQSAKLSRQPAADRQHQLSLRQISRCVVPVDTGSANSPLQAIKDRTAVTVRWAAHDDNGDDLIYSLYLRGDGEHVWRLLKDNITDKAYSFDAALIPDGGYQVKVVASDAPSHTPGEALTGEKESDRFEVDTTPPVVSDLHAEEALAKCAQAPCPAPIHVTFDAEDAASPIAHAEYSLDAGPWQYIDPVGKLSDSKREHYDFQIPAKAVEGKTGEHLITVRVYDRHDNVGVAKTVFGASSKVSRHESKQQDAI